MAIPSQRYSWIKALIQVCPSWWPHGMSIESVKKLKSYSLDVFLLVSATSLKSTKALFGAPEKEEGGVAVFVILDIYHIYHHWSSFPTGGKNLI